MNTFNVQEPDDTKRFQSREGQPTRSNIILMGAMASGKSAVGWLLARILGYGFIDLDRAIEAREGKSVRELFEALGEEGFRDLESALIEELANIRTHVIACGGGAVMRDSNWASLSRMGTTVWLNTPPEEIARRLSSQKPLSPADAILERLRSRPLLADLAEIKDRQQRHEKLTERMKALIGQRAGRYRQANLTISDCFSTPESTAALIRNSLIRVGSLRAEREFPRFDRWRSS